MTPRTTREQQKQVEFERGRQVAKRAERSALIYRYVKAKKLAVVTNPQTGDTIFHVGGVDVFEEHMTAHHYPSDRLMATLALAIGATTGLDDIPPPEPTHRVSPQAKEYNRRLSEQNKNRWGDGDGGDAIL